MNQNKVDASTEQQHETYAYHAIPHKKKVYRGMKKRISNKMTALLGGKIGVDITLLFSTVTLLFVLFSICNQIFQQQFSRHYENASEKMEIARELRQHISGSQNNMMQYLRSGNEIYLVDYQDSAAETEHDLARAIEKMDGEDTRFLIPGIRYTYDSFSQACVAAAEAYQSEDYSYYTLMYEMQNVYVYLNTYCEQLLQASMEESMQHYDNWETARRKMLPWNIFLIALLIIVFVGTVVYITNHITQPLDQLVGAARKVADGNMDIQLTLTDQDNEVNLLGRTFQQMVTNIDRMLEYEKEKADAEKRRAAAELEKADAERALLEEQRKNVEVEKVLEQTRFLALQSQTNPHFMFNTLNSIKSTVMTGKQDQALAMLDSFAALMRYNLKSAQQPVSLREELLITKEYMKIQKIRFGDHIHYHMRVDEGLLDTVTIPRFTLQPLVENAIIHGLEKKVEQGYVMIDAEDRQGYCVIRVFDNGVGMDEERLEEVLTRNFKGENRIGVANIHKRLEIFTGSVHCFKMESKPGLGTLVWIRLEHNSPFTVTEGQAQTENAIYRVKK